MSAVPTTEHLQTIVHEGYILDPQTGDIIGLAYEDTNEPLNTCPLFVGADLAPKELNEADREEAVADPIAFLRRHHTPLTEEERAFAEELLRRRAFHSAKVRGIQHEMQTLIAGIQERFTPAINEVQSRISFIDRWRELFQRYAVDEVLKSDGKSKTAKTDWATLSFRATKGAAVVDDVITAAQTLLDNDLDDAIKATIVVSELRKAADGGDERAAALYSALLDTIASIDGNPFESDHAVMLDVAKSKLPDELPPGVKGIHREENEHILGNFEVKHS